MHLALASLGQTRAGEVIAKTGLHRNLVYQALASSQEHHLVAKSMVGRSQIQKQLTSTLP